MNDKIKFKQDKKIFEGLNNVLNACKGKSINAFTASKLVGMSPATAINYFNYLRNCPDPYVKGELIQVGNSKRKSWHYIAIREAYLIDDYVPLHDKRMETAIRNGTYKNPLGEVEAPSHIRVIGMRHIELPKHKTKFAGIPSSMGMW
jgi:hypothetical protein